MANLWQTLLHPDREDDPERGEVVRAANLLQIGEFQLLQLAYFEWHGHELQGGLGDEVFHAYMIDSRVPGWARHYARGIAKLADGGQLDDNNPDYHRYDCDYFTPIPLGSRRLMVAVFCIAFVVCGAILVSATMPGAVTSVLPPYFNDKELTPAKSGGLRGS